MTNYTSVALFYTRGTKRQTTNVVLLFCRDGYFVCGIKTAINVIVMIQRMDDISNPILATFLPFKDLGLKILIKLCTMKSYQNTQRVFQKIELRKCHFYCNWKTESKGMAI